VTYHTLSKIFIFLLRAREVLLKQLSLKATILLKKSCNFMTNHPLEFYIFFYSM